MTHQKVKRVVVNENDEIIGAEFGEKVDAEDLIYRVSSVWVVSGGGQVLMQQRKFDKRHDPGKWGPSCVGTNDEGETYDFNAAKELGEEVGLFNVKLEPMTERSEFVDGKHRYFMRRYLVRGNYKLSDFTKQEDEVEALELVDIDDLIHDICKNPEKYITNFLESVLELKEFLRNHEKEANNV